MNLRVDKTSKIRRTPVILLLTGVCGDRRSFFVSPRKMFQKCGSSSVCDRTTQKNLKNRNTELKKTGIAPIVK